MATSTFGRTSGTGSDHSIDKDEATAFRVAPTNNGRVLTMHVYLSTSASGRYVKCVIWNDNRTVYAVTDPIAVGGSVTWYVLTFSTPVTIKKDVYYWLGWIPGLGGGAETIGKRDGSYSGVWDFTNSYASPQSIPASTDGLGRALYCTYTILGNIDKLSGVNMENVDKFMGVDVANIAKIDGVDT